VPEDPNRQSKPNALVSAARYSEIGFIIPAAVFLGYCLGRLLDYWLHRHWLYLAGVIFGAVAGFIQMIRSAMALSGGQNSGGQNNDRNDDKSDK
jgi:ATP synthase protein I